MSGKSLEDEFFGKDGDKHPFKAYLAVNVYHGNKDLKHLSVLPKEEFNNLQDIHKHLYIVEVSTQGDALAALTIHFESFLRDAKILPIDAQLNYQQRLTLADYATKLILQHKW